MKITVIKGHTPENEYDGYSPHNHWEVMTMPSQEYIKTVADQGLVFPPPALSKFIINPWDISWIKKNVKKTYGGYDFKEYVMPAHFHLYAFDNYHDGVDAIPMVGGPGKFVTRVQSAYIRRNKHATADIYELTLYEGGGEMPPLAPWQEHEGLAAIEYLSSLPDILTNPEQWKVKLDQPTPQWQLWIMLARIAKLTQPQK